MECHVCAAQRPNDERYCLRCGASLNPTDSAGACTVVISYDLDGPSGMINRHPQVEDLPSARSFGEYGPSVGAPHVLAMLERVDIPASFYIPGWIAERHPRIVERVAAADHEVGHHGYLHEPPATLDREEEAAVLDRGIESLRSVVGQAPTGYRSPSWELSAYSEALLAERGFAYDSSLMGSDAPHLLESGLVELPIHWSLDDYPYFVFGPSDGRRLMASPAQVYDTWLAAFEEFHARGGTFTLTMHPYIIGRPGRLAMVEQLIRTMQSFDNVSFMRADQVAAATRARADAT